MLQLNQKSQAIDLVQALEGESGVFRAKGPNGQLYEIVARPGVSIITKIQQGQQSQQYGQQYSQGAQSQSWQGQPQWQFRKIAELQHQGQEETAQQQQQQQPVEV